MSTLLEKALSKPVTYNYGAQIPGDEEIELALAYIKGEINSSQYSYALGKKASAYSGIVSVLRRAWKEDKIILDLVKQ